MARADGPRSMTGYGAAQRAGTRIAVEVEVRSVNNRSLKLAVRTPGILSAREPELDALVRRRIRRGSVTLAVKLQFVRPTDLVRIRIDVVEGFAHALEPLRAKGLVEGTLTPRALAAIPGAIESGTDEPLRPTDWQVVEETVVDALTAMDSMRQREAAHLVKELKAVTKRMRTTVGRIGRRSPQVVKEQRQRLRERVDALLADTAMTLDPATLAREVALLADRSDVAEEIARLTAHVAEFDGYLDAGGEIGRTLDFLSQEMLRETNTIGSKSADVELAKHVIALKTDVDRLKEQVQNLE
jgi:uncharacterized protein (TIGR00255 family)